MRIALATDHAGFELKQRLVAALAAEGHVVADCGCHAPDPVDYIEHTLAVVSQLVSGASERAICLCGNGFAMAMLANRFPGIRAAVCHDPFTARTSVAMGNANVMAIGTRVIATELALELVEIWLGAEFQADVPRYGRRLDRLAALDSELAASEWRTVLERHAGAACGNG